MEKADEEFLSNFAKPAQRALVSAGIYSLANLNKYSENEIKTLHGIGPNALKKIAELRASKTK